MIGFNFRMGEIEAAIGVEQLKKLPSIISEKINWSNYISEGLVNLKGLKTPIVKENCSHVYYSYPMTIDDNITGVHRDKIYQALVAEGVPALGNSYVNLHLFPMYQNKIAYGTNGFPWSSDIYKGSVSYDKGICPVAESMNDKIYLDLGVSHIKLNKEICDSIVESFKKVWQHLDLLK
jgi:dTDP-4-amino-4,6-dideoxygalactose transaminase